MLRCLCGIVLAAVLPAQSGRLPVPAEQEVAADPMVVAEAQRQLLDESLVEVAKGACTASEHLLRATVPQLCAALARVREQSTLDQRLCGAAVLDALVGIGAEVPPAEIAPFLGDDRNAAALVLLAQWPAASGPVLLSWLTAEGRGRFGESSSLAWLAAGELCLRARTPGLASALLQQLQLELEVCVTGGDRIVLGAVTGFSHSCGVPEEGGAFPEIATYRLTARHESGDQELVGGPHPVYVQRRVTRGFDGTLNGTGSARQDEVRLAWLASLAGIPLDTMRVEARTRLEVVWSDAQVLLDHVAAARAQIEEDWRGLRTELVRQRLLDRGDPRSVAPQVRVCVYDDRANPEPALPRVPDAIVQERR